MEAKECELKLVHTSRGLFFFRRVGGLWKQLTNSPMPKTMSWKEYCYDLEGVFLKEEEVAFLTEEETVNKKTVYPNMKVISISEDYILKNTNRKEDLGISYWLNGVLDMNVYPPKFTPYEDFPFMVLIGNAIPAYYYPKANILDKTNPLYDFKADFDECVKQIIGEAYVISQDILGLAASNLPLAKTGVQKHVFIHGDSACGKSLYAIVLMDLLGNRGQVVENFFAAKEGLSHRSVRSALTKSLATIEEVGYLEKYSSNPFKIYTSGKENIEIATFRDNTEDSGKTIPLKTLFIFLSNGFFNFTEGVNEQEVRRLCKVMAKKGLPVKGKFDELLEDEAGRSWYLSACVNYVADMLYEGKQKELLSFTDHDEEFMQAWNLQSKPSTSIIANSRGLFKLADFKIDNNKLLLTKPTLNRVLKYYDKQNFVKDSVYKGYCEDFEMRRLRCFGKRPRLMNVMIDIETEAFLELEPNVLRYFFDDPKYSEQLEYLKEQQRIKSKEKEEGKEKTINEILDEVFH